MYTTPVPVRPVGDNLPTAFPLVTPSVEPLKKSKFLAAARRYAAAAGQLLAGSLIWIGTPLFSCALLWKVITLWMGADG